MMTPEREQFVVETIRWQALEYENMPYTVPVGAAETSLGMSGPVMTTTYIMALVVVVLLSNDARRSSFISRFTRCRTARGAQNLSCGAAYGSNTGTAGSHVWGARRTADGEDRVVVFMNVSVRDARGMSCTMQVDVSSGDARSVVASVPADVVRRLGALRDD